jgi:hypothetical protein
MGVHWKSKQTQKNLLGKSTLAHKSSNLSPVLQAISPELVCPSGEQIVNGGFETGDWTGWTHSSSCSAIGGPLTHSGNYKARLWRTYLGGGVWVYGWIRQDFPTSIRAECFTSLGYWCRYDQAWSIVLFTIGYDDGSVTTIEDTINSDLYVYFDHLSSLTAGKKVAYIKIEYLRPGQEPYGSNIDIDDVTGVTTQP